MHILKLLHLAHSPLSSSQMRWIHPVPSPSAHPGSPRRPGACAEHCWIALFVCSGQRWSTYLKWVHRQGYLLVWVCTYTPTLVHYESYHHNYINNVVNVHISSSVTVQLVNIASCIQYIPEKEVLYCIHTWTRWWWWNEYNLYSVHAWSTVHACMPAHCICGVCIYVHCTTPKHAALTLFLKQVHNDSTWRGHRQWEGPISYLHLHLHLPKVVLPLQSAQALQPLVLSSVTIKHSAWRQYHMPHCKYISPICADTHTHTHTHTIRQTVQGFHITLWQQSKSTGMCTYMFELPLNVPSQISEYS